MTYDKKSDEIKAICSWLGEEEQKQAMKPSRYSAKLIEDLELREKIVTDLFTVSKTDATQKFIDSVYDEENKRIDIKGKELTNEVVWNILEFFVQNLDWEGNKSQKLETCIDDYFSEIGKNEDEDIKKLYSIVNNGRLFRNEVHPTVGKVAKRDDIEETWKRQLWSIILLSLTEHIRHEAKVHKNPIDTKKISTWFSKHTALYADINKKFAEKYLDDANKITDQINCIVEKDDILKNTWDILLSLINDEGFVCESPKVDAVLNLSAFMETFLHTCNCILYKETKKQIEHPSWQDDLKWLGKLSQHISSYDKQVFTDIASGYERVSTIGQTNMLSAEHANVIDYYFFKAICLIAAIRIAINKCNSGVAYYANNNIEVKPFAGAKENYKIENFVPKYAVTNHWWEGKRFKSKKNKVTGIKGDYTVECDVETRKGTWTVILFDFPPKQEGSVKKILYTRFPGLLNWDTYYEKQDEEQDNEKGTVKTPVFSHTRNTLSMHTDTSNAAIYYTLDSSTPTKNSNKYDKEITLKRNCTIKAIAVADGMEDSEVAVYKVDCFKVESIQFEKKGRKLAMTTATESTTIYYTLDGTEPTVNALIYRTMEPITVKNGMEVKAIAKKSGYNDSELATYIVSEGTTPLSEFIKKYWIWLAGIAFLALLTFTIVRVGKNIDFSSGDETPAEQSATTAAELYPILDGRSWVVKEMEGIKLPKGGSAKIVSMNDEGTECRMVIDTDFASQHREINLQYNRQTGDLSSPELGKGKVEKVTGFVSLKISFKGWTIEK